MNYKFDILTPNIFPKNEILAGITKKNTGLFPKTGFSISNADILSDDEVIKHRKFLADRLCIPYEYMKFQKQVHKTGIQIVNTKTHNGIETDGMITNYLGIVLNVSIADCTAILIFDPVLKVIGALHSGWKGTKENICKKGIELFKSNYNSNPDDLLVYLSPCASGRHYEVEWDVAEHFPNTIKKINIDKYLFDNQKQIYLQLIDSGIKTENIELSDICTIENQDFHSFRRDKRMSGRMSAFISIKT